MSITRSLTRPITRKLTRPLTAPGAGGGFTPADIVGLTAWWDNTDASTLFSDAARTTPAVIDGEVLGQTDKSGNGLHRSGTAGTGPILRQRSDGVLYLDYAGGKTLSVPASTDKFNFMHDGTGGTVVAFVRWPQGATFTSYLMTASGTPQVGFWLTKSDSSQNVVFNISRGVQGTTVVSGQIGRFCISSAPRMLRCSYKNDGGASDYIGSADSSLTKYTAATANAPSSANSSNSLSVGNNFAGEEYQAMFFSRVITDDEAGRLWRYLRRCDFAVPAVVDLTLLLGGQSNMSGRGTLISTLAETSQVGVYSYDKAEEFRLARIPEHSIENRPVATSPDESSLTAPQHGFALRAAKALNTDSAKDVLLVPCAIGSTNIAQWNTPETAGDRTTLFGAMAYRYGQAASKGGSPVIVWYGHESSASLAVPDFTNGGVGSGYQSAFTSLVENIRSEIVDAPLIMVQLASDDTLSIAEGLAAAGEAQRQLELSLPNTYMVVAHDIARNASPDDIHVSRAGMDVLADRVALAIREHVLGEPVNGTGPRIVSASYSGDTVTLVCDRELNTTSGNYGNLFRVYADGVEQTVSSANRGTDTSTVEIVCSAPLSGSVTLTYGYRAGPASAARTDFVADADGLPLPLFGPLLVPSA